MIFWFFDTTISSWKQLHSDRASYSIITESQETDNMQTDIRRTQACNHLQLNVVHLTVTWCKCFGIKRQSKTSFHYQLHCFRLYSCMSQLECNKAFWGTRDKYRVAGKSLAWPGRKQATATRTYDTIPRLTAYKQQKNIAVVCMPYVLV